MKMHHLLFVIAAALFLASPSHAQIAKVYRIGFLSPGDFAPGTNSGRLTEEISRQLAQSGLTAGANLELVKRGAEGYLERLPALVEQLVAAKVAVIVTFVFAGLPHIHTNYVGEPPGLVDRVFTAQGLSRQVVARSAMPLSIPFVLKRSPLVAILPDMLARMFLAHVDLRFEPLCIEGLSLPISLVRHRRERSDPLTGFVAGLLADSVAEWVAAGG